MKRFKTICRYAFMGLLLAACAAWCIYCHNVIQKLEASVYGPELIDLALQSSDKAEALLLRLEHFRQLHHLGVVAGIAVLVALVLMILFHIFYSIWDKKGRKPLAVGKWFKALGQKLKKQPKEKVAKQPKVKKAEQPKEEGGFCPNCGTPYTSASGFCQECGCSLEEK